MAVRLGAQGKRRDKNEPAIVEGLEAFGCFVFQITGAGAPDLLVGLRGIWAPMEVKGEKGLLTERQIGFEALGIPIVRTADEAIGVMLGAVERHSRQRRRREH